MRKVFEILVEVKEKLIANCSLLITFFVIHAVQHDCICSIKNKVVEIPPGGSLGINARMNGRVWVWGIMPGWEDLQPKFLHLGYLRV